MILWVNDIGNRMKPGARTGQEKRMTVKEYLNQIKLLDMKIDQRIQEAAELRMIAFGIRSPDLNGERVQISPDPDAKSIIIHRYIQMEEQINRMIDEFVDEKHKIIGEIQQIEDPRYSKLLYLRYVKYMSIQEISEAMHYGYEYTCRLHGRALRAFKIKNRI